MVHEVHRELEWKLVVLVRSQEEVELVLVLVVVVVLGLVVEESLGYVVAEEVVLLVEVLDPVVNRGSRWIVVVSCLVACSVGVAGRGSQASTPSRRCCSWQCSPKSGSWSGRVVLCSIAGLQVVGGWSWLCVQRLLVGWSSVHQWWCIFLPRWQVVLQVRLAP